MAWAGDWLWGLPLLVLTIVAHVCALIVIARTHGQYQSRGTRNAVRFVLFVALVALAATALLALEAGAWAALYVWLGAIAGGQTAMLYSLGSLD